MSANSQPSSAPTTPARTILVVENNRKPSRSFQVPPEAAPSHLKATDSGQSFLELIQIVVALPAETGPAVDTALSDASDAPILHPPLHAALPPDRTTPDSEVLPH
jgi:hypothetical protein